NPNWGAAWDEAALEAWRVGYEQAAACYLAAYRGGRPFALNVFDDKIVLHLLGPSARPHGCGSARTETAVAPSGRLYACGRAVGDDRDASLAIGHVDAGPTCAVAAPVRVDDEPPAPCRGCALRGRCASHCGCANREASGDPALPGAILCWHERMSIPLADRV